MSDNQSDDTLFTMQMMSAAYNSILDRDLEPEAYENAIKSGQMFSQILSSLLESNEYINKCAVQFIHDTATKNAELLQKPKITLIQTSDGVNYRDMLLSSAKYNSMYCSLFDIDYEMYIGLKFGVFPHHAMYNRIKMLHDFVRKGYSGWVFYLDADNLIQRRHYNFRELFNTLDIENKYFLFYNHYNEADEKFEFWDINTGVFAMRIGNRFVNAIIETWNSLYENHFFSDDYDVFMSWRDCVNDQYSLRIILSKFDEIISIRKYCYFSDFSDHVIAWFGRQVEDPTTNDISLRTANLIASGDMVYPELKQE